MLWSQTGAVTVCMWASRTKEINYKRAQLACAYHDCSEGIHVDKLFYRQVLKNVLRQLFFSSKHCTNITYSKSFKK